MIKVTIRKESSGIPTYVSVSGHAGYSEKGTDIVCAAVSALTINTVNSLERFTTSDFTECGEKNGTITIRLLNIEDPGCRVLIQSLVSGLLDIQKEYGNKYVTLNIEEV